MVKNPPENTGNERDVGLMIPWSKKWRPTPVFLFGKFYGQRSLVGYSPWATESDTEHTIMAPGASSLLQQPQQTETGTWFPPL